MSNAKVSLFWRKACFCISFLKSPFGFARSSSRFPHSRILPSPRTATKSAFWIVDRRWAMIKTVLPSISRSRASCTRYSFSASKALTRNEKQKGWTVRGGREKREFVLLTTGQLSKQLLQSYVAHDRARSGKHFSLSYIVASSNRRILGFWRRK